MMYIVIALIEWIKLLCSWTLHCFCITLQVYENVLMMKLVGVCELNYLKYESLSPSYFKTTKPIGISKLLS